MVCATRSKQQWRISANDLAILKARGTPASFAVTASNGRWTPAPHLLRMNRIAMDVAAGRKRRVMIFAPPRHGKSLYWSQYVPAWYVGTFPDRRVILTSYEHQFAASWGRKARDLLAEFGPSLFGARLSDAKQSAEHWEIDRHGGGMLTAGIGGGITGRGANLLIIDDPVKNAEESLSATTREKHWDWYQSTASTRLEPDASVVVMLTRWHPEDLAGKLLIEQPDEWEVISLPALALDNDPLGRTPGEALWPERWPREALEKIRNNIDAYWWRALYQQQPSRHGKFEWPDEYFADIFVPDYQWPQSFDARFMAGDPSKGKDSSRGDYAANVAIGVKDGLIWVDSDIKRRPVTEYCEAFIALARRYAVQAAGLEVNQFQELLLPELQRIVQRERITLPIPMNAITNTLNKDLRISRLGPYFARKELRFRDTPDNRLLIQQAREFANGDHDDGLDALEMAIRTGIEYLGGVVSDDGLGNNLLERRAA